MPSGWKNALIHVNGAELHYYRLGTPGKPALVLLHGFSDNGLCWQPEAEELKGEYDIFIPEMRGHGLSSRVQLGGAFDMITDIHALLEALEISNPVIAGHSMGAANAFHFAARYPDIPRAIILEDPPWFDMPPVELHTTRQGESPFVEFVASLQGQSTQDLIDRYQEEHDDWMELSLQRWCEAKTQLDPNFISRPNIPFDPWRKVLKQVTCPILLVTAERELGGIVDPAMAKEAKEIKPDLQHVQFFGVGHHIRFVVHEAYMQELKQFLEMVLSAELDA